MPAAEPWWPLSLTLRASLKYVLVGQIKCNQAHPSQLAHRMDVADALEASEPLHKQQLHLMACKLWEAHQKSDAVTWVPETIPTYVQQAVEGALVATADGELLLAHMPALCCTSVVLVTQHDA